jgi:signal transduction histidine kinase
MSIADSPARILVVDDSPESLLAIRAVLTRLDAEVVCAQSGQDALRHLLREDYTMALLDVEMPGMDGFQTAELIRARQRSAAMPILFITGTAQDLSRVMKAYATGATDFLVKPVDPDVLRAKVGALLELQKRGELIHRQERELEERRRAETEARRASELEKQLVAIVGHDVRGPLCAILATAQVQLRQPDLSEPQRRAFERVERSAQRISQIAALLLDYTRARLGQGIPLERTRACLVELARRGVDEFEAVHPDRDVRFYSSGERIEGRWDASRLSQVLSNLLDNAAKYGGGEDPIEVLVEQAQDSAILEVRNGGPPIPWEKLAALFRPFERVRGDDEHAGSSLGLGLFIVHEIVRGHDGSVEVTSSAEDGTRFRVRLPLEIAAAESEVA